MVVFDPFFCSSHLGALRFGPFEPSVPSIVIIGVRRLVALVTA